MTTNRTSQPTAASQSIRVHWGDEQDLRWFFSGEYETAMGKRSTSGGIFDTLERGAIVQTSARSGGISDQACRAARRLAIVRGKLERCTTMQRAILAEAFGPALSVGLEAFGQYPRAVLVCPEAYAAARGSSHSVPAWCARKALVARGISPEDGDAEVGAEDQRAAAVVVSELRAAAERRLADALRAYGSQVEQVTPSGSVSLRQIAKALGWSPSTVSVEVERRGIPVRKQSLAPNGKQLIELSALWLHWTEAAQRLCSGPTGGVVRVA